MTRLLVVLLVAISCHTIYEAVRPVEHISVQVTVQRGDTLQGIVNRLQREYGSEQDWREICYQVRKANGFTKYIMPGQVLNIPLEIKK